MSIGDKKIKKGNKDHTDLCETLKSEKPWARGRTISNIDTRLEYCSIAVIREKQDTLEHSQCLPIIH